MKTLSFDIIILGAGIVGSSLALALAQKNLRVALIEKHTLTTQITDSLGVRVSAINHASYNWFSKIGIDDLIKNSRISHYDKMYVWDDGGHIEFHANTIHHPQLGFIIENQVMLSVLAQEIHHSKNIELFTDVSPKLLHTLHDGVYLLLNNHQRLFGKLLIGADGAHSWLRQHLNIATDTSSYDQTAIIANVATQLSHEHTAWQHFLPTGPLAFLPFADPHHCSIVWSNETEEAIRLLSLNEDKFNQALSLAFDHRLGHVNLISERKHFPLTMRHAKKYIDTRIAFVGDAIHTIHPLAGLGLNLGLADATLLFQLMINAIEKNEDFANEHLLKQYEHQRKAENTIVLNSMTLFKQLFSNQNKTLHWLRNQGLSFINQLDPIKKIIVNQAND